MALDDRAGQRLHRGGVGDVEAHRLGAPPAAAMSAARRVRVIAARGGDDQSRPVRASRLAIARPMPRDAPVTSATLSGQIEHHAISAFICRQDVDGRQIVGTRRS